MNLQTYKFPKLDAINMAFSMLKTDNKLKLEAIQRGFDNQNNKWCRRFSELFFTGGKLNLKDGYNVDMLKYMKSFMSSFEPKHEEKEMICAMLLSELEKV